MRDEKDPTDRTHLGLALGAGALAVVAVEAVVLIRVATGPGDGFERAAIWVVLLMITVTFLTVGGIGYGFYRDRTTAFREGAGAGDDRPPGSDDGSGGVPRHPTARPGGPGGETDAAPDRGAPGRPGEPDAGSTDGARRRTPEAVGSG